MLQTTIYPSIRPKVLVLLAAFNGSRWIAAQLESILGQRYVDVTLIISDDCSTDGTRSQIERFATDPRVKVETTTERTGSAAQNFLRLIRDVPATNYSFVALSDQDDIWQDGKLFRACNCIAESTASGYSCPVTAFWEGGRETVLSQAAVPTESDFLFEGAGQGCTFVIAAAFYTQLRMFFVQHATETGTLRYHDWAIYALSRAWHFDWVFDTVPMVRYRQHQSNDTGARASVSGVLKRLSRIREGWYSGQLTVIGLICCRAAPDNKIIGEWQMLRALPHGFARKYRMVRFCLRGGRRRPIDRAVLILSVVLGWV